MREYEAAHLSLGLGERVWPGTNSDQAVAEVRGLESLREVFYAHFGDPSWARLRLRSPERRQKQGTRPWRSQRNTTRCKHCGGLMHECAARDLRVHKSMSPNFGK